MVITNSDFTNHDVVVMSTLIEKGAEVMILAASNLHYSKSAWFLEV